MRLILAAALFQVVLSGNVNIRMPYLNPAGVTYVDSSLHAGLSAGPLAYTTATARPFAYNAPQVAPYAQYAQPISPIAYQPVTKYAAVPTVQHVHGVADVPVTRYEAQPALIQKAIDVAKPAIKTRKYEIRRPAIQKQFYDIEERVIVRPAGSALVELDEPVGKSQKGAAIVSPAAYAVPAVHAYPAVPAVAAVRAAAVVPAVPAYARLQPFARFGYGPYGFSAAPAHFQFTQSQLLGTQVTGIQPQPTQPSPPQGQGQPETPYPFEPIQSTPAPQGPSAPEQVPQQPERPQPPQQPQFPQQSQFPQSDDDDSVSVDNPEFSSRSAPAPAQGSAPEQDSAAAEPAPSTAPAPENAEVPQPRPTPEVRSAGVAPTQYSNFLQDLIPQPRSGLSPVPSLRNLGPEISQANQQRLIDLFTARGGVTEVGLARAGPSGAPLGDAGQVRARVISATPAPLSAEPTGERVNTRRVVVSSPIETLQEIEVQEPVTKLERIHVNHPTLIKTARQDIVRVPTSVPVYGKAFAPVAHAAVPVAQAAYPTYSPYYG